MQFEKLMFFSVIIVMNITITHKVMTNYNYDLWFILIFLISKVTLCVLMYVMKSWIFKKEQIHYLIHKWHAISFLGSFPKHKKADNDTV